MARTKANSTKKKKATGPLKKRANRKKVTPKSYLPVAKVSREELVLDNNLKQPNEDNGCTQNSKTESQTRPFSPYDAQLTDQSHPFFQACSALDSSSQAAVSANDIFSPSYFSNVSLESVA